MRPLFKSIALPLIGVFFIPDVSLRFSEASLPVSVPPAQARIGRPLTPLSYGGVARRTTRRVIRRNVARVAVLPAGCIYGRYYGAYYYRCGGVYYARSSGSMYR